MLKVTLDQIISALRAVGLQAGDGVMTHAALQFLGLPEGGIGIYYAALRTVLGLDENLGTLVVPTFNFGFARGEPFDQAETPAEEMGVFPEYVRRQPGVLRSPHPMQSVAAVGRHAADLCSRDTSSAFDPGSAFERMLELDFKLLLLGADVRFTSMVHLPEQRLQVPYRYWKEFTGEVRLHGQPHQVRTYRMYARDLDLDPDVDAAPVQRELERRGLWTSIPLNYGRVAACRLRDFVAVEEELLRADPWALVKNRPDRPPGQKKAA
ncbi:MAG: AAC(3) family N-acetyltransferase [Anaerolineales bacterium]